MCATTLRRSSASARPCHVAEKGRGLLRTLRQRVSTSSSMDIQAPAAIDVYRIYIYRERERERQLIYIYIHLIYTHILYMYIYVYICVYIYILYIRFTVLIKQHLHKCKGNILAYIVNYESITYLLK